MKTVSRLTDLEIKIMKVLWEHENLTIQEIASYLKEDKLSVASITQVIKHLMAKKAVVVGKHVLVSSVYARTFLPCFTKEEFLSAEFARLQKNVFGLKKINPMGIIAALLNSSGNEEVSLEDVEKLQKLINERKNLLKDKEV